MKNKVKQLYRAAALLVIIGLVGFSLTDLFTNRAAAAQITARSVTIGTAVVSATGVTYTYGFTTATAGTIQTMKFEACTTALGSCTAPTGMNINLGSPTLGTGWQSATAFARDVTGGGGCTPANNVLCLKRTSGTSENAVAKTISESTQTNPSGASCASSNPNCTFFIKITIYSDTAWASAVDSGTVASSTTQTLTISAAIQEVLNFCVGSTAIENATSTTGADCSAISGTSVGLGILDSTKINISPVTSNSGNNLNGVAMLRTNANGGATVTYRAIQQSGTNHAGSLRVVGASCNSGNVNSDQCIDSKGTTQGVLTAGTESFGMTIAAINCGSTTAYTCTYSSGTYNLTRNAQYDGTGANTYPSTDADVISGPNSAAGYAWREDGNVDTIATSSGAVDDEAMILKFAATPNIVTPTGSYQAQADFIVVATY